MLKLLKTNYNGIIENADVNVIKETDKQYKVGSNEAFRSVVRKSELKQNLSYVTFGIEVFYLEEDLKDVVDKLIKEQSNKIEKLKEQIERFEKNITNLENLK